jgi:Arc/MetJ-type ribon-helix-helix transcriptional regulator
MKRPGSETIATKSRSRRLSPRASEPETSPDDCSLQWVTARLPPALVREIEAHAKSAGTSRSDAIRELLGLGLETIRARDGVPGGRVEEVLGAIESVRVAVELLGPSTLGTQRLLAHWAARDGGVRVSEDEPLAEVRAVGADEWEQAVADAERDQAATSNAALQGERG